MKKLLFLLPILFLPLVLLPAQPAHAADRYFEITVAFDRNNAVSRCDVNVLGGEPDPAKDAYLSGQYYLKLIPFTGTSSVAAYFDPAWQATVVKFSYTPDIEKIEIYDTATDESIYAKNIAYLSRVCGDNTCQPHESFETCPSDCPSGAKDDYCDQAKDGKCDPDCVDKTLDPDCHTPISGLLLPVALIGVALVLIIVGFIIVRKKKSSIYKK